MPGTCFLCNKAFPNTKINEHLKECLSVITTKKNIQKRKKGETKKVFHLFITGKYSKKYWMHILISVTATLEYLDTFLRNIWLDCCGHLSQFIINGQYYVVDFADAYLTDNSMMSELEKIVEVGKIFLYEYDFGSTTELKLTILSQLEIISKEKNIQLIARNNRSRSKCQKCKKNATQLCTECSWEMSAFLCETCAITHDCGEEMLLPIVNSPRSGVCGYTG